MEDPEGANNAENVENTKTPPPEPKKNRRRSSIGGNILSSFLSEEAADKMSPAEPRAARPRRAAQMRPPVQAPPPPQPQPAKPREIRYSFDLGERVAVKSCLKPTVGPILVRKGPALAKSAAQRAAAKIVTKYRKSSSLGGTPSSKRGDPQIKFHQICTIRVITPRPDYNPDKLEMPHSDEEEEKSTNPNRERLSTVQLRLTPTSEAQLEKMKTREIVQFNAQMVFGDGESVEAKEEEDVKTAREPSETWKMMREAKKKCQRRKSLIVGAASPLKSPAKEDPIERPRFEVEMEDEISEPKRKPRRSVRLKPADTVGPSKEPEDRSSKKRELQEPPSPSTAPQPKRNRKSVGSTLKSTSESKKNRRKSGIVPPKTDNSEPKISAFFAARPKKEPSPVEEAPPTQTAPKLEKSRKRRSTRFPVLAEQPSTSSESENPIEKAPPKLFSLFSPKPAKPVKSVDLVVDLTGNSPKNSPKKVESKDRKADESTRIGVKREEKWGDACAETYQFMTKMPMEPAIFDEFRQDSSSIFKPRPFDENILKPELAEHVFKMRTSLPDHVSKKRTSLPPLQSTEDSGEDVVVSMPPEKIPGLEGVCPTTIYPSTMDLLNEGAEEAERVRGWLRKWKRRVRKDAEREMRKEKASGGGKRKGKMRKKRKTSQDSDEGDSEESEEEESDDEYQVDGDADDESLENPLVLIGPTGVGKTALIRALAKQENMRLISTGPEVDRTGAEIKKRVQEAMRSHRVDQHRHNRIALFYQTGGAKGYTAKEKTPCVLDKEYTQSLIVFEHVDVFFDSLDRGGWAALVEVLNEAAVPVVFTCENGWPRDSALKRRPLEIHMGRNKRKTQKYVQQVIYSCRDVHIPSPTMARLSKSVSHDLSGLLRQAHFYSLAPSRSLPMTSRAATSSGFEKAWEPPPSTPHAAQFIRSTERAEQLVELYADVLDDERCDVSGVPPRDVGAMRNGSKYAEHVRAARVALNGRYTEQELVRDVLPLLKPMDEAERRKTRTTRRHLHRFRELDSKLTPTDGEQLIAAAAAWNADL